MSLWRADALCARLGQDALAWVRAEGASVERRTVPVAAGADGAPWRASLDALAAELTRLRSAPRRQGRTNLDVVLGTEFLRYRIIPWLDEFVGAQARSAYVQFCFSDAYGESARHWTCIESAPRYGQPSIAAAIDTALLDELRRLASDAGCRLRSARPSLIEAYDASRAQLPAADHWFVLGGARRIVLLLMLDGAPALARMAHPGEGTLQLLVEREWNAAAIERPVCPVYYCAESDDVPVDRGTGRWTIRTVARAKAFDVIPSARTALAGGAR